MDDFLTEPWFIVLLGSVLALMMLSFGAMVFVKRKHMLLKQGALGSIRGKFDGEKNNNNNKFLFLQRTGCIQRSYE